MAWLLRLPRVVQIPIALAIVVGACWALALLACSLPAILLYLWMRRRLAERSAYRMLIRLAQLQGAAPLIMPGQVAHQAEQLAAQPGERPPLAAGASQSTRGEDLAPAAADSLG